MFLICQVRLPSSSWTVVEPDCWGISIRRIKDRGQKSEPRVVSNKELGGGISEAAQSGLPESIDPDLKVSARSLAGDLGDVSPSVRSRCARVLFSAVRERLGMGSSTSFPVGNVGIISSDEIEIALVAESKVSLKVWGSILAGFLLEYDESELASQAKLSNELRA